MNGCATPQDGRLDSELVALNQRATAAIPRFFENVRIEQEGGLAVRAGETWLAYCAVEIYGNADTALIAITHNRGRTATLLERQMYEMLKRAQYYLKNQDEARLEYLAMPFRDKKLADDMNTDKNSVKYLSILHAIEVVSAKFPDVVEYVAENKKEKSFYDMVLACEEQNQAETRQQYGFHYRRVSQTAHASVSGILDVFDYRMDDKIGLRFDGRLDDPNFSVQMMTIYLIDFLDLVNDTFKLGKGEEIEGMKSASEAIMARLRPAEHAEMLVEVAEENAKGALQI